MCKSSRERTGSLCFSFSVQRALLRLEGRWELSFFLFFLRNEVTEIVRGACGMIIAKAQKPVRETS